MSLKEIPVVDVLPLSKAEAEVCVSHRELIPANRCLWACLTAYKDIEGLLERVTAQVFPGDRAETCSVVPSLPM